MTTRRRVIQGWTFLAFVLLLIVVSCSVAGFLFFYDHLNEEEAKILKSFRSTVMENESLSIQYDTFCLKNEVGQVFYSIKMEVIPNYDHFGNDWKDPFWMEAEIWYELYSPNSWNPMGGFSMADGVYFTTFTFNTYHEDYLDITVWGSTSADTMEQRDLYEAFSFRIDVVAEMAKLGYSW